MIRWHSFWYDELPTLADLTHHAIYPALESGIIVLLRVPHSIPACTHREKVHKQSEREREREYTSIGERKRREDSSNGKTAEYIAYHIRVPRISPSQPCGL